MNITLESPVYVVKKILKKTKAKFFDRLTLDSKIQVLSVLHGGYANMSVIVNIDTGERVSEYNGIIIQRLDNFILEEA